MQFNWPIPGIYIHFSIEKQGAGTLFIFGPSTLQANSFQPLELQGCVLLHKIEIICMQKAVLMFHSNCNHEI